MRLRTIFSELVSVVTKEKKLNIIKRLDQGQLQPKLDIPGMICPSRESNLREATTLEKNCSNSLLVDIRNIKHV